MVNRNIVILGAGFGGLNCTLQLNKRLKGTAHHITLVDQHPYHLLTPALYQVGTAETPNRSVSVPLKMVLAGTKIAFKRDKVLSIDQEAQKVMLAGGCLEYDFLVMALGNDTDYYGIPGLQEHAVSFKTVYEAGRLRLKLTKLFQSKPGEPKRLIVGGGGFTGTELVGELVLAVENMADRFNEPLDNIEIVIIEGADRLLPNLSPRVSAKVKSRLEWLGVKIRVSSFATNVTNNQIELSTGAKLDYDLLVWTGGVSLRHSEALESSERNKKGNYIVNQFLMGTSPNIFIIGDMAAFTDPKSGVPLPGTAPIAVGEAKTVALNITRSLAGREPLPYRPKNPGYIIPLAGKYAVAVLEIPGRPVISGRIAFLFFQLVMLKNLFKILPVNKAVGHWRIWMSYIQRTHKATRLPRYYVNGDRNKDKKVLRKLF